MRLCFLFALSLLALSRPWETARAQAAKGEQASVIVSGRVEGLPLGRHLEVLEDPGGELALPAVSTARFRPHVGDVPNIGFTRSTYWFRTAIENRSREPARLVAEIRYPMLSEVDFYVLDEARRVVARAETGNTRPWATRPVGHPHFVFPFAVDGGERRELYVRVFSQATVQVPLTLWSEQAFVEADQWSSLLQGIYAGFMLVMTLYNFFLYFSVRERTYLLYVLMVFGQLAFQFTMHGLAFALLWPDHYGINDYAAPVLIPLVIWSANAFAIAFLDVRRHDPQWARVCAVLRAVCLATSAFVIFVPFDVGVAAGCVLAATAAATVVVALVRLYRTATRSVVILAIAWTPLLLGTFLLVAEKCGWIPTSFVTENLVQMGSAFEVVVLSLAVGDRINTERNAKLEAQELALEHERVAQRTQQEALLFQRRANETLEQRVKERTQELAAANARLAEASTIDALTGLRNRRYFNERFHEEFARCARQGLPLSVLMVDVDHFKQINDTHGHLTGDHCLVVIADVLRKSVARATDTVARYGGEEFVIVLPDTDADGARTVAEVVRRGVENVSIEAGSELIHLSVSVGALSRVPTHDERRELFLSRADGALYEAKQAGRNRVHVLGLA